MVFGRRSKVDQNPYDTIDLFMGAQLNLLSNLLTLFPFLGDLSKALILNGGQKKSDIDYKSTMDIYKKCLHGMQQREKEDIRVEYFAQELSP